MKLYEVLIKIQTELSVPKNQYNKFGGYSYRSCEDILESVKPMLAKYGVTLTLEDFIVQLGERYYVQASAVVSNGEEQIKKTAYAREADAIKGMSSAQITGAASSYARKYALAGLFLLDDNKDADYLNKHGKDEKKPVEAQNTDDNPLGIKCEYCGKLLGEEVHRGKKYSVDQVVELCKEHCDGHMLHLMCVNKWKEEQDAK